MKLSKLLNNISITSVIGDVHLEINKIEFDSRKIHKGDLFVAIKGISSDGHEYINQSIKSGAVAIVLEDKKEIVAYDSRICYVFVEDSSSALSILAGNYYHNPSNKIKLIGVTGTNGKTTTVSLLYKLFCSLGYSSGMLSTIENKVGLDSVKSTHTTGDSLQINKLLSDMV